MKKYIAIWNAGYGNCAETVEAKNQDDALNMAYELWREDTEDNADYRAEVWTQELEDDYSI